MTWTSKHIEWLIDTGERIETEEGKIVEVWEFRYQSDESVLTEWAKHFRSHYCLDNEIDDLRRGYGYSRAEYLNKIKLPDEQSAPGPSIRAGDFGEVLVADYLEYVLRFWVPRTRYGDKATRNESTRGCDIIGFKASRDGGDERDDTLAVYEAKAQFSGTTGQSRLQDAVSDSAKDPLRRAESLNAIKQRLRLRGSSAQAELVERFQNPEDRPYEELSGAAALFTTPLLDRGMVSATKVDDHPNVGRLSLVVIHGADMMQLVHELYRRAADEA